MEKKACPTADRKVPKPTLLKSGLKRKLVAAAASPTIRAKTTIPASMMKKAGIRMVAARSIPPLTPRATMNTFKARKTARKAMISNLFESVSPNFSAEVSAVRPANSPPKALGT